MCLNHDLSDFPSLVTKDNSSLFDFILCCKNTKGEQDYYFLLDM